jgi:large subunit ribosomal protein L29
MKVDKVRALDDAEIRNQMGEMQDQMFRLRFQMSMGQTDGLKKLREIRRDRARMLGVLRERELDPAKAQAAAEAAAAAKAKDKGKKKRSK